MHYRQYGFAAALMALLFSLGIAHANEDKDTATATSVYSADAARSELRELYRTLQASHFDLFVHRPKSEYDARYDALLEKWTRPFSHLELQTALQRFMAYGRVAHSRIDFPSLEFEKFRTAGGAILPLDVKLRDGRAYVAADLGDAMEVRIEPGEEIVAINGTKFPGWRKRLLAHVSADNDRLADTLLELRFPALLWLELGAVDTFDLTVRGANGKSRTLHRSARSRVQMREAETRSPKQLALDWSAREARMLDEHLAYLRPGPFYDNRPGVENIWDPGEFSAFIDSSMKQFREARANTLIIDLRNNPGGDNSFSDLLVRRYADRPFRFASRFLIKVSAASTASNAERVKPGDTGAATQLAKAYAASSNGEVIEFPIDMSEPDDDADRFRGRVFLLVNRYSYSNTVMVAALSQDYHFATILGEETADLASTYGAMEQFTLPRSSIMVGYPKAHIVRPSGDTSSRGVVPDVAIETPLLEQRDDPVLAKAIAIAIRSDPAR
jgi:hypothetical protein